MKIKENEKKRKDIVIEKEQNLSYKEKNTNKKVMKIKQKRTTTRSKEIENFQIWW